MSYGRVLNMPILNMSGLRILPGREFARITQATEYAWIRLAMPNNVSI